MSVWANDRTSWRWPQGGDDRFVTCQGAAQRQAVAGIPLDYPEARLVTPDLPRRPDERRHLVPAGEGEIDELLPRPACPTEKKDLHARVPERDRTRRAAPYCRNPR